MVAFFRKCRLRYIPPERQIFLTDSLFRARAGYFTLKQFISLALEARQHSRPRTISQHQPPRRLPETFVGPLIAPHKLDHLTRVQKSGFEHSPRF